MVSTASTSTASTITILAGRPLGWCRIGILPMSSNRSNSTKHLGGHGLGKSIHSTGQI